MKKFLCALTFVLMSFNAAAWGPVGHRTVALIAEQQLTPQARDQVRQLLGSQSLADVANWADGVRRSGKYTKTVWYHFEKIPDSTSYLDNLQSMPDWQKQKGGVVTAILRANDILRDTRASASEQADALKFLVHFTGDIHQPLHTGRPNDSGGNKLEVNWFGTSMPLHKVWDSGMMYSGHSDFLDPRGNAATDSEKYVKYLSASPFKGSTDFDVEAWLNESMSIREPAYDPIYKTDQSKYQRLHLPEVDQRLQAAGYRLGALLNSIFARQPMPPVGQELKKNIENILKERLEDAIDLRP